MRYTKTKEEKALSIIESKFDLLLGDISDKFDAMRDDLKGHVVNREMRSAGFDNICFGYKEGVHLANAYYSPYHSTVPHVTGHYMHPLPYVGYAACRGYIL